jgi:hypothetical protein
MPEERIPEIPKALLEWLDRVTPFPSMTDSDRDIHAKLGKRDLIDKLRVHFKQQNETK